MNCRDFVNKNLTAINLNNSHMKSLLLNHWHTKTKTHASLTQGVKVNFKCVFWHAYTPGEIVGRLQNPVAEYAKPLTNKCKNLSFELENPNCCPRDLEISFQKLKRTALPEWERFFNDLFPQFKKNERTLNENLIWHFRSFLMWPTIAQRKLHRL